MGKQNLYGSLNRLQNFPLDLTSIYETKTLLDEYINKDKRAYIGQLICVYNDSKKQNNGLYIVESGASAQGAKTSLKIADEDTVATLTKSLDNAKEDILFIQDQLPSYAPLTVTDNLRRDLDALIGGTDIVDTMNSIKEISNWIEEHEAELGNIESIRSTIDSLTSSIRVLNTSVSSIENQISSLGNIYVTKTELASYSFAQMRRSEVLSISSSSENRSQTKFDSSCMIESIELDISASANFSGRVVYESVESNGSYTELTTLVPSAEISFSEVENYSYDMINYSVVSPGRVHLICSANSSNPGTLSGTMYIHYVKLS